MNLGPAKASTLDLQPLLNQTIAACIRSVPGGQTEGVRIADALRQLGCRVNPLANRPWRPEDGSVLLILGNAYWYPPVLRQLLTEPKDQLPVTVIWHWEPLPPPDASGLSWPLPTLREIAKIILRDWRANDIYTNYRVLKQLWKRGVIDVLATSTPARVEFLAERGIHAHYLPLGYTPDHGCDLKLERDIDVLFLGDKRPFRRKWLISRLRRRGINLMLAGDWADPAYWGENRTRLINRSKIYLNVQRFPGEFSGLRLVIGMANKALIVSEPMYNPAPFVPGVHYVSATIEEMPRVIEYYLAHEEERERIAAEGHRFVTEQLPLSRSVHQLIELMNEKLRSAGHH
jgi:hypothetical protein